MKKTLLISKIILLSFTAHGGEVINGLDIDQKYQCKVAKVYQQPKSESGKVFNIRPGTRLIVDLDGDKENPTIRDLAEDMPFYVGKFQEWFYQEHKRAPKMYEKQCKGPCIIYSTSRFGRWVFEAQRDGTMNAFFDRARHPDFKTGTRLLGFKCIKSNK